MAIQRSQPQPLAEEVFFRAIYGNHPYGRLLPVAAEVERFNLEQAKKLWTRFAGADRAHLYVVGRFDPAAVRAAVEEAFGGWGKAKGAPRPKPAPKAGRRVLLLDRPDALQSTVRLGLPAIPPTSPDYIPLVVTDALLGGSFGSRITANIREKHGYTYSPRERHRSPSGSGHLGRRRRTSPPRTPRRRSARSSTRSSGSARSPPGTRSSPASGSTWPAPSCSATAAAPGS